MVSLWFVCRGLLVLFGCMLVIDGLSVICRYFIAVVVYLYLILLVCMYIC